MSEHLTLSIFDSFHHALVLVDENLNIVYTNSQASELFPEKHLKNNKLNPVIKTLQDGLKHQLLMAFNKNEIILYFKATSSLVAGPEGQRLAMMTLESVNELESPSVDLKQEIEGLKLKIQKDKEALKSASDAFINSESRLNSVFHQSPISVQIVSREGKINFVNRAWQGLWGLDDENAAKVKEVYNIFQDQYVIRHGIDLLIKEAFNNKVTSSPSLLYDPSEQGLPGRPRWIDISFHPVKMSADQIEEVICLQTDVTQRQEALIQKEKLLEKLGMEQLQSSVIVQKMPAGLAVINLSERKISLSNQSFIEMLGGKINTLEQNDRLYQFIFMASGETQLEIKHLKVDGSDIYLSLSASSIPDQSGKTISKVIIVNDITQKKREEELQLFMGSLTENLLSSLEGKDIFKQVADGIIPFFADGCEVCLVEENELRRVLSKHQNADIEELMHLLPEVQLVSEYAKCPAVNALYTQKPQLATIIDKNLIRSASRDESEFEVRTRIGLQSYLIVPLLLRGKALGTIAFFQTSDRPGFTLSNLKTAEELSTRISMALDNSRLYKEARNAIGLRDDFISIASHELKTPITALKLQLKVVDSALSGTHIEPADADALKKVSRSLSSQIDRMAILVNDMLDISRVSVGKLSMRMEVVDLSLLLKNVIARFSHFLTKEGQELLEEIEPNVWITCDAFRIEQVISNLLSNAIKYGDKKPVKVILEKDVDKIYMRFIDSGQGIDPKDQIRIFNQFERALSVYDGDGLGLGLFISQEIMKRHHGLITVKSDLFKGSVFTVEMDVLRTLNID